MALCTPFRHGADIIQVICTQRSPLISFALRFSFICSEPHNLDHRTHHSGAIPFPYALLVPTARYQPSSPAQFVLPGWRFLEDSGRGMLRHGGSWAAYVPPPSPALSSAPPRAGRGRSVFDASDGDFSIVIEKLNGDCLRCQVCSHDTSVAGSSSSFQRCAGSCHCSRSGRDSA